MSSSKKFGTFGGVFTPSILTILGVIMFLRLPYIVGQAGLWLTLGIIAVAHVISVTTGLSVASIATDKKVEAGGSYYMISRSLGLPIGGTLGIALFVGMSFSVSLYLIGFAESFLGYWGMPVTIDQIRLTGSIALAVVAIVTLISTSLAMKTQYLIMTAIALSLGSVLIGGFRGTAPTPHLTAVAGSAGFAALFGIFFPAVTGFEAGVSMSGDLKNPKKSIPMGTIAAIVVGLVVYMGLAVFLALRIDGAELSSNLSILEQTSIFAPVFVAGVWGATVSSALGSILGAPRILQAASADRIAPRFFSRGYGPTNEPRNALVLTLVLAECGILIGELDVLARIVTMFFITAYGFLNISCALESWVSPDFRPEFRIPRWISLGGAVTCLVVMIQLDLVAMLGATTIMALLLITLKRRQLRLESGDTYEGLWSSIVKRGLYNLSRSRVHQRNWRPNMILFSGGEDARPELVNLARQVALGGMISNFDLTETSRARLRPRSEESVPPDEREIGLFTRSVECDDVYAAMEDIARYYGFSGVEPNTVLLGRARSLRRAERFGQLVQSFGELDYNVLLFDHGQSAADEEAPGNRRVDVWWSGHGNSLALALSLIRFLQNANEWRDAEHRFLSVTQDAARGDTLRRYLEATLEAYRIEGSVRVVFNGVQARPISDIIREESAGADLVFFGMPDFAREDAQEAVHRMNGFSQVLKRILWVRASSYFGEIYTGLEKKTAAQDTEQSATPELPAISYPDHEGLRVTLGALAEQLESTLLRFHDSGPGSVLAVQEAVLDGFRELSKHAFDFMLKEYREDARAANQRLLTRAFGDLLFQIRRLWQESLPATESGRLSENWQGAVAELSERLAEIAEAVPTELTLGRDRSFYAPKRGDSLRVRFLKFRRRAMALVRRGDVHQRVPYRIPVRFAVRRRLPRRVEAMVRHTNQCNYEFLTSVHRLLADLDATFRNIDRGMESGHLSAADLKARSQAVAEKIEIESGALRARVAENKRLLIVPTRAVVQRLGTELNRPDAVRLRRTRRSSSKDYAARTAVLREQTGLLSQNLERFASMIHLDLEFLFSKNRLRAIGRRHASEIQGQVVGGLLGRMRRILETWPEPDRTLFSGDESALDGAGITSSLLAEIRPALAELPEEYAVISDTSLRDCEQERFVAVESSDVAVRRYLESVFESDFSGTLREISNQMCGVLREGEAALRDAERGLEHSEAPPPSEALEESPGADTAAQPEQRLARASDAVARAIQTWSASLDSAIETANEKLNPFHFVRAQEEFRLFVRRSERLRVRQQLKQILSSARELWNRTAVRLWFGRSRAALFARELSTSEETAFRRTESMLKLGSHLTPAVAVVGALPRYYRHLFLEKSQPSREFWVGRRQELEQAGEAVRHFRNGKSGVLFVSGPPESGKTYFSRFAAERSFPRQRIFELFVPGAGDARPAVFKSALERAAGPVGAAGLPDDSAVIINDLELYWQRTEAGYEAIDSILDLANSLAGRSFFIVNTNPAFLRIMREVRSAHELALGSIECRPFAADDLQELILRRHRVSGMRFELNAQDEERVSRFRLARFFDRLFQESGGWPGPALRAWIRAAQSVRENVLGLNKPEPILDHALDDLPADWRTLLVQFFLHKRMNSEKIASVCGAFMPAWRESIASMERAGLLQSSRDGTLIVQPALAMVLYRKLTERGYV